MDGDPIQVPGPKVEVVLDSHQIGLLGLPHVRIDASSEVLLLHEHLIGSRCFLEWVHVITFVWELLWYLVLSRGCVLGRHVQIRQDSGVVCKSLMTLRADITIQGHCLVVLRQKSLSIQILVAKIA